MEVYTSMKQGWLLKVSIKLQGLILMLPLVQ